MTALKNSLDPISGKKIGPSVPRAYKKNVDGTDASAFKKKTFSAKVLISVENDEQPTSAEVPTSAKDGEEESDELQLKEKTTTTTIIDLQSETNTNELLTKSSTPHPSPEDSYTLVGNKIPPVFRKLPAFSATPIVPSNQFYGLLGDDSVTTQSTAAGRSLTRKTTYLSVGKDRTSGQVESDGRSDELDDGLVKQMDLSLLETDMLVDYSVT